MQAHDTWELRASKSKRKARLIRALADLSELQSFAMDDYDLAKLRTRLAELRATHRSLEDPEFSAAFESAVRRLLPDLHCPAAG
jgi:hypothetical protein